MSSVRTFVSFAAVLVVIAGLAGCYDLSADGPSREDFIPRRASPAAAEQDRDPGQPDTADTAARLRAPAPLPPPPPRSTEELEASEVTTAPGGQRVE